MKPNPDKATRRAIAVKLRAKGRRRREGLMDVVATERRSFVPRNDLLASLQLVSRKIDQLIPPARHIRKKEEVHVREVLHSIQALGFVHPILIDGVGNVIDGLIRLEAAKLAGLTAVPCILVDHLTPSERRLLRIALNRLQEKGEWNLDELRVEFDELALENAPIEITGFSGAELDQILVGEDAQTIEAGPLAPAPDAVAVARLGDVFRLETHLVGCGDATQPDVLARVVGERPVRFVFTDVPYNVPIRGHVTGGAHREFAMASGEMSEAAFRAFNRSWIEAALPYLVEGGILATFIDWRGHALVSQCAVELGLSPLNLIVWTKTNAGMGSLYRSQHELLPLFKKGSAAHVNNVELGRKGRWRSNVWTYPGASSLGSDARRGLVDHPTVKPVAMLEDALIDLTDRGDLVLDPFLGSGSTLIAAEKTGRTCAGVELDPLYVDVIIRRFEKATGKQAVLVETGETFVKVAERRAGEGSSQAAPSRSPRKLVLRKKATS